MREMEHEDLSSCCHATLGYRCRATIDLVLLPEAKWGDLVAGCWGA